MDRLYPAAITVERPGGLFFDAAVPGVDDGIGVEGALLGREQTVRSSVLSVPFSYSVSPSCVLASSPPFLCRPSTLCLISCGRRDCFFSSVQMVRANMDSPTVAAATEGGSPFYKIYEIYLVRQKKNFRSALS